MDFCFGIAAREVSEIREVVENDRNERCRNAREAAKTKTRGDDRQVIEMLDGRRARPLVDHEDDPESRHDGKRSPCTHSII